MIDHDKYAFKVDADSAIELLKTGLETFTEAEKPTTQQGAQIGTLRLVNRLGRGGMGDVWVAIDTTTGLSVAVKWMHVELAFDESSAHRFRTEAKHMAGLSHPHIVKVLQVGEHESRPYYSAPLYRQNLATYIARNGPLSVTRALEIARCLAGALAYAHGRGIIHRDLKPANVLLDDNDNAYLGDFGLVRTFFNDSIVNVQKKTIEGTIAYMSPATACGQAEDTRCDIYGWGATLYEMLTAKPPYEAVSMDTLLEAIRSRPPKPILSLNPRASKALAQIAEGAMARELRDRYAEMSDIVRDLDRVRVGQKPLGPRGPKATKRLAVAMVAGALLVGAGSWLWWAQKKNDVFLQDAGIRNVVPDEPTTQKENEEMNAKTIAMMVAAVVTTQTLVSSEMIAETQPPGASGKLVTLTAPYPESLPGAETDKITLQYAVIEISRQEGLGYEFGLSQTNVGEVARKWITPDIREAPFTKAMDRILLPLGLGYEVHHGKVVLIPKRVSLAPPYPTTDPEGPEDKRSLQDAVLLIAQQAALGYDFNSSQKNVGEIARRWVKPNIQNEPFTQAMQGLLNPFNITYEVRDFTVVLVPAK